MGKYADLFCPFARIGAFTFGGGYVKLSLLEHECMEKKQWLTADEMTEIMVIAESTPGPIAINCATYTGLKQAGLPGAVLATLGMVLPSFLIMLVVPRLQKKWSCHRVIRLALRGVKPCLAGVICATGIHLAIQLLSGGAESHFDPVTALLIAGLGVGMLLYPRIRKKQLSPILLIVAAATLGMLIY